MPTWFPPRRFEAGDRVPPKMGRIFKSDGKWVWEWGNLKARSKTWAEAVATFERHRKHHVGEGPT